MIVENAELVNQTQWSCGTTPPENMPIFLTGKMHYSLRNYITKTKSK